MNRTEQWPVTQELRLMNINKAESSVTFALRMGVIWIASLVA